MGLTFVDLFCGIGTIRMGMEQAGHKCTYSVEWDKHKRKIYGIIFGGEPEGADIREVHANDIPRSDIWTFGAPCQDFSIAGTRSGLEGDRSSLIREVFRLVRETQEEHRPKYLLYENVKGMLSSNKGFDYLEILSEMESLGYDIEWQLLNSKNFGVPQNRERVFTLGHLRGRGTGKIFPISRDQCKTTTKLQELTQGVSDALRVYNSDGLGRTLKAEGGGWGAKTGLYFIDMSTQEAKVTDHARCLQARYNKWYSHHKGEVSGVLDTRAILTAKRTDYGKSVRKQYEAGEIQESRHNMTQLEPRKDGISNTITTVQKDNYLILQTARGFNKGGTHEIAPTLTKNSWEHNNHLVNGYRIRRLTPKECWRLQGVLNEITDKVIQAGISDSQMYRGAGDACTVNVIYEIAKKLI